VKPLVAALFFLVAIAAHSDHGPRTWERTHASVVSVLPTWPGYEKPGFGAPLGVAPEGSGVVIGLDARRRITLDPDRSTRGQPCDRNRDQTIRPSIPTGKSRLA